jgi:hypothetical protein
LLLLLLLHVSLLLWLCCCVNQLLIQFSLLLLLLLLLLVHVWLRWLWPFVLLLVRMMPMSASSLLVIVLDTVLCLPSIVWRA